VVDAFHSALKTGDSKTISGLTDPAVIIAEGGSVERSLEVYAGHHMPADMAYTAAVSFDLKDRQVLHSGDMATVISQSDATGTYEGKAIHMQTMENDGPAARRRHLEDHPYPLVVLRRSPTIIHTDR